MKTAYALILSLLVLLASACSQKVNDPADIAAIKNLSPQFDKAEMAKDAAWFTSAYYLDNASVMPQHEALITGKEAIGKEIEGTFAALGDINMTSSADEVLVSGDLAVSRGKFKFSAAPAAGGLSPVDEAGKFASVYRRQSDGAWKCLFEIWNSDEPARGATADGVEEAALYQMERDWVSAILQKDTAVVDRFLADEFISNLDGQLQNKKQFLAEMRASRAKIESAANSDMKAMVFGDTAIVHGLYTEKSTTDGKDTSSQTRYTEVYVKRDGRWQCVTQYLNRM